MSGHAKHDQECGQDYSCPDKSGRARPAGARNRQVSLIKARSWSDQSVWGLAGQARAMARPHPVNSGPIWPSQGLLNTVSQSYYWPFLLGRASHELPYQSGKLWRIELKLAKLILAWSGQSLAHKRASLQAVGKMTVVKDGAFWKKLAGQNVKITKCFNKI